MLRLSNLPCYFLLVGLVVTSLNLSAQTTDGDFYESRGQIPKDFLVSWSEKLEESLVQANNGEKEIENFWLDQHHQIDALLQSGRYAFGDPITQYLNEIADHLLRDKPELRKEIRIYTFRAPSANGFTVADGIIAIHIGLIAHVKTEAELAFVLAHEIAHYERNHLYDRYKLNRQNKKSGWFSNSISPLAQASSLISRSKEHEIDADLVGLELYLNSDYTLDAVDTLLTTLNYSHLPFGRRKVNSNPFCVPSNCYTIPEVFYRDDLDPLQKDEFYPDAQHLHPNIGERRSKIRSALVQRSVKPGVEFRLGKERFNNLQEIARFESIREKISVGDYSGALYDIYNIQASYPQNKFLTLSRVKALYGLASYKAVDKISSVLPSTATLQGPYEQVVHLTKQMNRSQIVSIALQATFSAQELYPEEKWLERYSSELAKYLVVYCKEEPGKFLKMEGSLPSFTKAESDFRSPRAYQRAQKSHYKDFYRYLIKNPNKAIWLEREMSSFISYRDSVMDWRRKSSVEIEEYWEDRQTRMEEEGSGLNIHEMVILDPTINVFNVGEDREERLDALKQEESFKLKLQEITSELGIETQNLYMEDFTSDDVDAYNRFCQLEEWVFEARFFHSQGLMPVSIDLSPELKRGPRYVCRIVGVIDFEGDNTYFLGVFDLQKSELVFSHLADVGRRLSMKDLEKETRYALEIISN